eukprot:TRINITY_DN21114_c0_g1_i1.p1 TRINITY_DN21114_c0_g1~~TRINITY_DN21114_c0_g1_i1.p1  ORF type:complete len:205 (-),score=18.53 TRINITY_DN21114_c0_g1_i1:64-657(-)
MALGQLGKGKDRSRPKDPDGQPRSWGSPADAPPVVALAPVVGPLCDPALEPVHFYGQAGPWASFSNFASYPIQLGGLTWATTEHYFQAQKFAGTPHAEEIRLTSHPAEAKRAGADRSRPLRRDWNSVRDQVMLDAVRAKFQQHAALATILLSTDNRPIAEHTENDRYWGDGGDGTGGNKLGITLMQVRNELRAHPNT